MTVYKPVQCDNVKQKQASLILDEPFLFSDGIPVTVYKPVFCDNVEAPSILVYIHGGGNVVGSRKTQETVCKILAR